MFVPKSICWVIWTFPMANVTWSTVHDPSVELFTGTVLRSPL